MIDPATGWFEIHQYNDKSVEVWGKQLSASAKTLFSPFLDYRSEEYSSIKSRNLITLSDLEFL
jgi:hypothetical protein